ncbi:hypothetical protein R1sor_018778 [Riccia sorocarpa]|uniref:FLYWCH-type domain-containing protein n=1 Tax=Riccia sorocarpa TaxID=122646 RepID=A0ABD3IBR4_9MARC
MATSLKSRKGNEQIAVNGYIFERESVQPNGRIYWRCVEVKKGCKGRAIQDELGIRAGRKEHDHPPRTTDVEVRKVLTEIKTQAAIQQTQSPRSIVANAVSGTSSNIMAALPSITALKKQAQRSRQITLVRYGRTRRAPTFAVQLWNQYHNTLEGLPHTNNSVEGWHRTFSSLMSASHPSGRKKYTTITARLFNIITAYPSRDLEDYLNGLVAVVG